MAETLYASFAHPGLAEQAAGALMDHGVPADAVSIVVHESYRDRWGTADVEHPATAVVDEEDEEDVADREMAESGARGASRTESVEWAAKHGLSVTTPADAAAGAVKGAGIGAGVGAAAALVSLFIPGIGFMVGAGALVTALSGAAGAAAAGAVAGGLLGWLKDQGIPETEARQYHEAVESGGAVVAVEFTESDIDRASVERILAKYGAANVSSYSSTTAPA